MDIPFWFLLALIPPFLWSLVNHTDKYLLSRFAKGGGIGSILVLSSFFSILTLPVIYFLDPGVFEVLLENILILILAGFLSGLAIFFYLTALFKSHASNAVPIFQTIPVFGFVFGYLFLGEVLTSVQFLGSLIIIIGAILISIDYDESNKISLAKHTLLNMLCASLLYALYDTLFKVAAIEESFWVSIFWQTLGLILFGIVLFLFNKTYRREFVYLIKNNGPLILLLNVFNESSTLIGNFIFAYATLLAPIALVMSISAYQPMYVFIIGIFISLFLPGFADEDLRKNVLIKKGFAILIILVGSYFIYQ